MLAPRARSAHRGRLWPWLKPQPEFAAYALEKLGAEAITTALVGDSPWDVEAAKRARFAAGFMVTTGTHTEAELRAHGAEHVAPGLVDLKSLLFTVSGR